MQSIIKEPTGLEAASVISELLSQNATMLFHANTVRTAISFLKYNGILSRQKGETIGQTSQYTDDKDKLYDIWDKIFIDTVNIHRRLKRRNLYGPVCFVFELKSIAHKSVKRINMTSKNPSKWNDKDTISDRWYVNISDMKGRYKQTSAYYNSLVLSCTDEMLPFENNLKYIVLDDPKHCMPGTSKDAFKTAKQELEANFNNLRTSIVRHNCGFWCSCTRNYKAMADLFPSEFNRLFGT